MRFSYFVSQRIRSRAPGRFTSTIQRVAIGSIAVSLAVLMVSYFILTGYQREIREKIFSFGAHITVARYATGTNFDDYPIRLDEEIYQHPENFPHVTHVQAMSIKATLVKTEEGVEGVFLKGVDHRFDTARFNENMVAGRFIQWSEEGYSNELVVSQHLADLLRLELGDKVFLYFVQNPPRVRRVEIVGIYSTYIEDFDQQIALGDLGLIQQLNRWGDSLAGGFEVYVDDFNELESIKTDLYNELPFQLSTRSVRDMYVQFFEWLNLLDFNEQILITIVLIVCGVNMISILLILIMERTAMIGLLKALGATHRQIQGVFFYNAQWLIVRGLLIGNVLGLGLAYLQDQYQLVSLSTETYYMEYVPIEWSFWAVVAANVGTIVLVNVVLLLPTLLISRIRPVKALKFA